MYKDIICEGFIILYYFLTFLKSIFSKMEIVISSDKAINFLKENNQDKEVLLLEETWIIFSHWIIIEYESWMSAV